VGKIKERYGKEERKKTRIERLERIPRGQMRPVNQGAHPGQRVCNWSRKKEEAAGEH